MRFAQPSPFWTVTFALMVMASVSLAQERDELEESTGKEAPLFTPDLTLLQPRNREEHKRLGGRPPYFSQNRSKGRELVFLAARHGTRLESSTHVLVEAVIKGFAPDCVVLEGFDTQDGPSPEHVLRDARRKRERGECPEPLFAATLAAERSIPFHGGEPPAACTANALRRIGTDRDALAFLVVRHLGQARRERGGGELDRKVQRALPRLKKRLDLDTDMSLQGFKDWYRKSTGLAFKAANLASSRSAPVATAEAGILQRMATEVMLARERHLLELEARLLGKHRRVLVIYGSGHLVYEAAVLRKMLGEPVRKASRW